MVKLVDTQDSKSCSREYGFDSHQVHLFYERKVIHMTKETILAIKKNRLASLENNPKDIKCGGVVRRLRREVRNLEK